MYMVLAVKCACDSEREGSETWEGDLYYIHFLLGLVMFGPLNDRHVILREKN
jgi:hypothetical protein